MQHINIFNAGHLLHGLAGRTLWSIPGSLINDLFTGGDKLFGVFKKQTVEAEGQEVSLRDRNIGIIEPLNGQTAIKKIPEEKKESASSSTKWSLLGTAVWNKYTKIAGKFFGFSYAAHILQNPPLSFGEIPEKLQTSIPSTEDIYQYIYGIKPGTGLLYLLTFGYGGVRDAWSCAMSADRFATKAKWWTMSQWNKSQQTLLERQQRKELFGPEYEKLYQKLQQHLRKEESVVENYKIHLRKIKVLILPALKNNEQAYKILDALFPKIPLGILSTYTTDKEEAIKNLHQLMDACKLQDDAVRSAIIEALKGITCPEAQSLIRDCEKLTKDFDTQQEATRKMRLQIYKVQLQAIEQLLAPSLEEHEEAFKIFKEMLPDFPPMFFNAYFNQREQALNFLRQKFEHHEVQDDVQTLILQALEGLNETRAKLIISECVKLYSRVLPDEQELENNRCQLELQCPEKNSLGTLFTGTVSSGASAVKNSLMALGCYSWLKMIQGTNSIKEGNVDAIDLKLRRDMYLLPNIDTTYTTNSLRWMADQTRQSVNRLLQLGAFACGGIKAYQGVRCLYHGGMSLWESDETKRTSHQQEAKNQWNTFWSHMHLYALTLGVQNVFSPIAESVGGLVPSWAFDHWKLEKIGIKDTQSAGRVLLMSPAIIKGVYDLGQTTFNAIKESKTTDETTRQHFSQRKIEHWASFKKTCAALIFNFLMVPFYQYQTSRAADGLEFLADSATYGAKAAYHARELGFSNMREENIPKAPPCLFPGITCSQEDIDDANQVYMAIINKRPYLEINHLLSHAGTKILTGTEQKAFNILPQLYAYNDALNNKTSSSDPNNILSYLQEIQKHRSLTPEALRRLGETPQTEFPLMQTNGLQTLSNYNQYSFPRKAHIYPHVGNASFVQFSQGRMQSLHH